MQRAERARPKKDDPDYTEINLALSAEMLSFLKIFRVKEVEW